MLAGIAGEATSRYGVHGFQIDDHFSVHEDFGFNADVLALFEQHLVNKRLTQYSFAASGLQPGDRKAQNNEWRLFRAGLVTRLAESVAARLPASRPGFVYQISPAGDIGFSLGTWLQNWRDLVEDRAVQEVVIQAYRDALGPFIQLISQSSVTVSRSRAVVQVGVFAGYKGRPRDTGLIVSQIRAARQRGMGVSVFFFDTLFTGDPGRTSAVRSALLASPRP